VQVWIADTRAGYNTRVRTVDGVSTTSGGPNIATGTFIADAETQVITVASVGSFGPQVNLLQLRELPLVVTTTADSGAGSLRQAVANAEAVPGANTILFDAALSGGTITLGSEVVLNDDLLFDTTSLPAGLTIDAGAGTNRIFTVSSGKTVILSGVTFTGGFLTGSVQGGAIYNSGTLTLTRCSFTENAASRGGAIFSDPTGNVTLTECSFSGNQSSGGAAIYNQGTMTLTRCTLSGNTANLGRGGAIYNMSGGQMQPLTLTQCTLSGNTAQNGGAIYSQGGPLTLTHCTISGNTVTESGQLQTGGGGVSILGGSLSLTNCLIAGNIAETNLGPDVWKPASASGIITRSGTNLIGNNNFMDATFPTGLPNTSGDYVGTQAAPLAPQVGPLGGSGGPTQIRPLLYTSLALNRITTPLFATDQRGVSMYGNADVGAFEAQLGGIASVTIAEDSATPALPFSVGTVGSLIGTSSDTALVSHAGIILGGSGGSRSVVVAPVPDAHGSPTITITDSASGETTPFVITIEPVNDVPSFIKGADQTDVVMNSGRRTVPGWATAISPGPANESAQMLAFIVSSDNPALFSEQPAIAADGTLTFTPAPVQSGTATVTVRLQDSGSGVAPQVNLSAAQTFIITVASLPTLTVSSTADSGPGSLRDQITAALLENGSRRIVFAPALTGQTITLSSEIVLTDLESADTLSIDGSGGPIISGGGTGRLFTIPSNGSAALRGLKLTAGNGAGATSSGNGGAILNQGTLTLAQCTLSGNTGLSGGAIHTTGTLTLTQCTLSGNTANQGGAIRTIGVSSTNSSKLTMTQCTLSGNTANQGGAIHTTSGTLTLTHCTLSANTVSVGGKGISCNSSNTLTVSNCLFAGNFPTNQADIGGVSTTHPFLLLHRHGVNLIGNNSAGSGPLAEFPAGLPNAFGDYVGNSGAPLDPQLAVLGDYGGPTWTMPPLVGSLAVNAIPVPQSEAQMIQMSFSSSSYTLSFNGASTVIPANTVSATTIQAALNALPTIGGIGGNVTVTGLRGADSQQSFIVVFDGGTLAGVNQPQMNATGIVSVTTLIHGTSGIAPATDQRGFPIVGLADIGAYENGAPTLSAIADQVALSGMPSAPIALTIGDAETAAASLTVTGTSSNTLVPNANIFLGGTAENRTVTITPATNQTGTATITLTVSDGANTTSTSFNLTVLANTPYNAWKLSEFGNNAANPAVAGDTADADHDGQNTVLEYATRGQPLARSTNPFSPPQANGPAFQISFPYRTGVTDMRYIVQRSTNLSTWTEIYRLDTATSQVTETGNVTADENSTTQIITVTDPDFTPGGSFWKLVVERL
jgi:predicted outer membrane repeat protein